MHQGLWSLTSLMMKGRALQLVKAVMEGSNEFDAWRNWNEASRPTPKVKGLALLEAVTTWPALLMNSALQPQFLKLEEALDEIVKSGTAV